MIDGYVANYETYVRILRTYLDREGVEIRIFADHIAYFNAVTPIDLPDVLIMGNVQIGMTGLQLAARLRREDFADRKIFIFTGDPSVEPTKDVDGVFYKPSEFRLLADAINQALPASV